MRENRGWKEKTKEGEKKLAIEVTKEKFRG